MLVFVCALNYLWDDLKTEQFWDTVEHCLVKCYHPDFWKDLIHKKATDYSFDQFCETVGLSLKNQLGPTSQKSL